MLSQITSQLGCISDLRGGKNRYELLLDVPSSYLDLVVSEIEENISDVICVNYKYSFLKIATYPQLLSKIHIFYRRFPPNQTQGQAVKFSKE